MEIYTIGHSNLAIETFIDLLQKHDITALGDVRSHPYSRYLPHFNKTELKEELMKVGINYAFLGQELGARPNKEDCYIDGKAVYERIAATDDFGRGIKRILTGVKKYKIALMCAEKDPITCHRAILVCQHLQNTGLDILHIRQDGELETHKHLEDRLLKLYNFQHPSIEEEIVQLNLFNNEDTVESRESLVEQAYQLQGDKIAYVVNSKEDEQE